MANHEQPRGDDQEAVAARIPDRERQATLTTQGCWLTRWVSDGKDRLVKGGIIQKAPAAENALRGAHERFTPGPSPIDGGWRRISGERGMRITVLHPTDPQNDPTGYTEFELADLVIGVGKSSAAETTDRVRIDVYRDGTCHVSGAVDKAPFDVDRPNPGTSFADLDAAERLLCEAATGLDFVAPGITSQTIASPQGS